MRFKGTILLTVVLILLGGYLLWFELPHEKKAGEAKERENRVLDVNDQNVTGLVFKSGNDEIELERHPDRPDQKWEVVRPIVGPANDGAATEALSTISRLTFSRVVDEKPADLKPYGLDTPEFSATVVINHTEVEQLQFGANNPIGSEVYLKRRGDKRVLLVGAGVRASLKKPLKEWRRPQIFSEH
ncbi:MAG TPA: DUF4340 domain-containing protein, partial [Nitrospiria bacterium]|nr:DUF4340 domain-containing protein [Nitrospiria bacterium]